MQTDLTIAKSTAAAPARRAFSALFSGPDRFSRLRGEIDRLFDDLPFRVPSLRFGQEAAVALMAPALEMTETKKIFKITAELPGIYPSEVEVSVEDGMVRIADEKSTEHKTDEKGYRLTERSYGSFERLVRIPAGTHPDKIKASHKNGLLTVTIPKDGTAADRARKIAVEHG